MTDERGGDAWRTGGSYERYMGRWSREIAGEFLQWLARPPGLDWVDVGCGTGALTGRILDDCAPRSVCSVDPSEEFIAHALTAVRDPRARFHVGSAGALPCAAGSADVVACALAYNFFPDRPRAIAEMQRVLRPEGMVGLYVWDYPGGGMGALDAFWDAACEIDPAASAYSERNRFAACTPEMLLREFRDAGILDADVEPIEVTSTFASFEDFWDPFTLGTGPAPAYLAGLPPGSRDRLRRQLEERLGLGGPIRLPARAWALRGRAAP